MKQTVAVVGGAFLIACGAFAQSSAARPEFEVADVKPNKPGEGQPSGGILPGGQFSIHHKSLREILTFAYQLRDEYIIGGPGWLSSDYFDIVGKAPASTPESTLRLMLQTLLAQRFKLATHQEQKPMDVLVLMVGKNGPRLQKAAGSGPPDCKRVVTPQMEAEAVCENMTMPDFAVALQKLAPAYVDREVLDATGLTGTYDVKLNWVGRDMVDQGGLTLFGALDKMLGLKLQEQKRTVPVMVIDHVEKPGDN